MESYAELQKKIQKDDKKKNKKLKIALIVVGAILLIIIAVALFFYFKIKKMGRNAPPFVPTAIVLPDETANPADLVEVEDPGYISIPDDNALGELTQEELDMMDKNDQDDELFDPYEMEFGDDPIYYVPQIDSDIINILILGNDAQSSDRDHGRTDVMQILSYNKKSRKAKLVSMVRDSYVYIPGRDKWNRINTAYRFGGVGLAMNTINVNFGTDIRYYIRVDLTTMRDLVDAVGGIDVELSVKEVQYINRLHPSNKLEVYAGVHHLNGVQAVRHARNRSVGTHVWSRSERHNQILKALFERAKQEKNPVALMSLMYSLVDKLDTNMDVEQMVSLGVDAVFGGSLNINSRLFPFEGTWNYAMERGMAVVKLDIPANKSKLLSYLYGN